MAEKRVIRKSRYSYPVIVEPNEDGYYVRCPALQGCSTQGRTYEEAMKNIKDAIILSIESRKAHGEPIPTSKGFSLTSVEVRA